LSDELSELLDMIDTELYLDRQDIRYRLTRGSSGMQLNVKECPSCGGSSWKVYLNAETGLGNCFHGSCEQVTFNKFSFIRAHLGDVKIKDVIEHIKVVASEQGWKKKRTVRYEVENDTELKLPDSIELPFEGKNLKYLTNRGITSEIAKYFYLRYSKNGVFEYHDGASIRRQSYASRIIIPIYNLSGELVSFQGRDITGESDKRYLFPPGFSSTGKYLYNGHNALGAKRIVLCEGAFDVMAAKMALDCDVSLRDVVPVGTFGKHLSSGFESDQVGQLMALKDRGLKEVVFMWDSESAAIAAAVNAALLVKRIGIKSRVAILPEGKDPNEATVADVIAAYNKATVINKLSAVKLLMKVGK
jgi:DNA primase